MTKQRLAELLKQAYEEGWYDCAVTNRDNTGDWMVDAYEKSAIKAMADSLDKVDYFLVADAEKMKEETPARTT